MSNKITTVRGVNSPIQDATAQPKCVATVKTYGNIWTRQMTFDKGEMKHGHKHQFDHLHFLAQGSIIITVYAQDDRDKVIYSADYAAPAWIKVPKDHFHDVVALEDNTTGYCIQAIHNPEGNVVDSDYVTDSDWMDAVNKYEKENGMRDEVVK